MKLKHTLNVEIPPEVMAAFVQSAQKTSRDTTDQIQHALRSGETIEKRGDAELYVGAAKGADGGLVAVAVVNGGKALGWAAKGYPDVMVAPTEGGISVSAIGENIETVLALSRLKPEHLATIARSEVPQSAPQTPPSGHSR